MLSYSYQEIKANNREQKLKMIYSLFEKNPIFLRNFLNYYINKSLRENARNSIQYKFALDMKDIKLIKNLLPKMTSIKYNDKDSNKTMKDGYVFDKGFYFMFNDNYYKFPTFEEINNGIIYQDSKLQSLLLLRRKILAEISSYEIYEKSSKENPKNQITDQDLLNLNYLILKESE